MREVRREGVATADHDLQQSFVSLMKMEILLAWTVLSKINDGQKAFIICQSHLLNFYKWPP
jgi:hypothetical protein